MPKRKYKFKEEAPWRSDPVYEYVFRNKMQPFVEWAKEWWKRWKDETFYETGSYPAKGAPAGMFIRFSRTLAHSPIHGVQAFPYVSVPFLQIHHVPGGVRRMVDDLCHEGVTIDGFRLYEKKYLHGTDRSGQFIAIIPADLLGPIDEDVRGRYVWLNSDDLIALAAGTLDIALQRRFILLCRSDHGRTSLHIERAGQKSTNFTEAVGED